VGVKRPKTVTDQASNVETIRLVEIGNDRAVPARLILKAAKNAGLHECVVIGRDDKGEMWAKSSLNASQTLWLLEQLKRRVCEGNAWSVI
jgi:hypothetical protein